ncbi:amidohydrolase family protein [Paraburkholderia susongensis]|uniref:Cytosine/adenosine deaminase n=1 Tax=Paraburkholderia susongensis TaxID=1515439 RepID=A0A1X7JF00_9BURK|nr:amidohydrolase [Paraburkholderia susongensis]SMG26569.1 Cytosine/adenosine deaminase [Paraburkholderia susongensis]
MTLLLETAGIVTMNRAREVLLDASIAIDDGRVVAVGETGECRQRFAGARRVELGDCLAVPGFIDTHQHPAHFLSKGLLDDVAIEERWRTRLYPFERALSEEETYWGAVGSFVEMAKSGTTCVADPGARYPEAIRRAAETVGIRLVLSPLVADVSDPSRPVSESTTDELVRYSCRFYDEFHGANDGLVKVYFGLWNPNSVSDDLVLRIAREADQRGTGIHGHLATRPADNDLSIARYGQRCVARYETLGVLGPNFLAAHMGAISDAEVEHVARRRAHVAHCPSASMLGGFGCVAHGKFPELLAAGVNVTLGSDAASISRFLDMPRIIHLAACAHKDARMDATVVGADKAFDMATLNGGKALMWDDEIGSIAEGKSADLTLISMDGWEWQPRPRFAPVSNLVYSSGGFRVRSVMVAGNWVIQNGRASRVAEEDILPQIRLAADSACRRAGLAC